SASRAVTVKVETPLEVKFPFRNEVMRKKTVAEQFVLDARRLISTNKDPRVQSYELFFPPSRDLEILATHAGTRDYKGLFEHIVNVHQIDKRVGLVTQDEQDAALAEPKAHAGNDEKWEVFSPALTYAFATIRHEPSLRDRLIASATLSGVDQLEKRIVNKVLALLVKEMKSMFIDFAKDKFKHDGDHA